MLKDASTAHIPDGSRRPVSTAARVDLGGMSHLGPKQLGVQLREGADGG